MLFYERCDKTPSAKTDTKTDSVKASSGSGSAGDVSPATSGEEPPSPVM